MTLGLRRAALCALFILSSAAARAQTAPVPSPSPSAAPLEIGRIVTSDRQDEPLGRTSRPTFVVTRRAMEAAGARTVADALRSVPGLSTFRYGPFGAQVNYGLLGATSAQTLVLLDGFPISPASSGVASLGDFSLAGVERIEVVEGGGSTLYGTSAVGGIINIITGRPAANAYGVVSYGTVNEWSERLEARAGALGVAFERHTAANAYAYPSLDGFPAGTRANAYARTSTARLTYRGDLATNVALDAGLGNSGTTLGVPGSLLFSSPNARQDTARTDAHVSLTRRGARSSLSLSLAGMRQPLLYRDPDAGGESDVYDSRLQLSLRDVTGDERSSLVAGFDLSRESALLTFPPGSAPPAAAAALAQSALYGQYGVALSQALRATVGLRAEHDAPNASAVVPSFGATVTLGKARVAVNAAGSFRVPTIEDLYYPGFSNPKLLPERARSLDATVAVDGVSLGWFGREAVNLINLDANFVPQNVARASLAGFIVSAKMAPARGLSATLGVTNLYRSLNVTPPGAPTRLDFEPPFTVTLGLERALAGNLGAAFGIDARLEAPHLESGAARPGETTLDAYLRERLAGSALLTVRVRNLGNARYAPILGYPAPGRSAEIELSTR